MQWDRGASAVGEGGFSSEGSSYVEKPGLDW
jgi:hypothetical protein